ncbi:MAG: DUF167 domain-containing protein [candidate division WOR-3 bacterium]
MFIKVKVFPNAQREEVIKKSEDTFEVKVKAKPEKGEANKEVRKLLSLYFKVPEAKIRLIKGFQERNKIFTVEVTK